MSILDRVRQQAEQRREPQVPRDEAAAKAWPDLWELLTSRGSDEKHPRQLGSVRIWCEQGDWRWAVNDPDTFQSFYGVSGTLAEVFGDIEAALHDPAKSWSAWSNSGGGKHHNGKK